MSASIFPKKNYDGSYILPLSLRLKWTITSVGGFFLTFKDFGRMFNHLFPACAFFFFFKAEISSRSLIPLFMPGSVHSGSAS